MMVLMVLLLLLNLMMMAALMWLLLQQLLATRLYRLMFAVTAREGRDIEGEGGGGGREIKNTCKKD